MSAAYAPAIEGRCCICDPSLQINANLCPTHKAAGKEYAAKHGVRFIDAADHLYWNAREDKESFCVEHDCWHRDCPDELHLDFSLIRRDAILPSQLLLLEARRGSLSTGFPAVLRMSNTGGI